MSDKDVISKFPLFCIITLLTLFVMLFSGCVTTPSKDELIIQSMEITFIDNRMREASTLYDAQMTYQYQGYLGMLAPGETIYTMPGVAENWTKNEHRTEWTFHIRQGLTFHDGSKIDAKAVRYSIYANWLAYWQYDNMSEAVTDHSINVSFPASDPNGDGYTVIFSGDWFPDPMFEFDVAGNWKIFTLVPYGSHGLYTDSTEVCQAKYANFTENPISCGPYKFKEKAIEDYILLERFDDWFGWGQTFTASNGNTYTFPSIDHAFKTIKYRFVSQGEIALIELRTGGVDIVTTMFPSLKSLTTFSQMKEFDTLNISTLAGASMWLNIQGDWPEFYGGPGNYPVSQTWFRRAVSHAIDRSHIVNDVYLGIGKERNTIFSEWILEKFPAIDTSDYYDFDQGVSEAKAILDVAGYIPLGFNDEPDNRFGWGLYANETFIGEVEQKKGRHFILTTMECDFCSKRALSIQKDLKQIGIYVDVEILEWGSYLDVLYEGTPGLSYNTSYTGEPDPQFNGPHWDFVVGGFGGNYETPWDFIAYQSFAYWMFYGYGGYSWYSVDYEFGYAKATGGRGLLDYIPEAPTDNFPYPEWSNDDSQFIEGCEDAGYLLASALPRIPLIWYMDTYAFKSQIKNFIGARNRMYSVAYAYWE